MARRTMSPTQREVIAGGEHDQPRLDQRPSALAENTDLHQRLIEQLAEEVAAERAAHVVDRKQRVPGQQGGP